MNDSTTEFFQAVAAHRYEPLLRKATGTVRFDLDHDGHTEHWLVTVTEGDVTVTASETAGHADAVFHANRALFDRAVTGEANAFTAILRGAATIEGDVGLLLHVFRLLPGPVSPGQRRPAGDASGRPR